MKRIVIAIVVLMMMAGLCEGANCGLSAGLTYYIQGGGTDQIRDAGHLTAGTTAAPWATHPWQGDWCALQAGDTVIYMDGAYTNVRIVGRASGSAGSPITTTSQNGAAATTLTGDATNITFYANAKNYVTVSNLTLNGNASATAVVQFDGTANILTNCTILNWTGVNVSGILAATAASPTISNNTVSNGDVENAPGIYTLNSTGTITISGNTVSDCSDGIRVRGAGATLTNNTLTSNVNGINLITTATDNTTISGGTISGNTGSGIYCQIAMTGTTISGVTFSNNGDAEAEADITATAVAASATIARNTFLGDSYMNISWASTLGATLVYNLFTGTVDANMVQIVGSNSGQPSLIYNNTFNFNTALAEGHALVCQTNCVDMTAANNIIINNHASNAGGIVALANAYNVIKWDYNLMYNAEGTDTNCLWKTDSDCYREGGLADWKSAAQASAKITNLAGTSNLAAANDLEANPQTISTSDFRLRPASPAKDTGTDVSLTTDYQSRTVPKMVGVDRGAYEYPSIGQSLQNNLNLLWLGR